MVDIKMDGKRGVRFTLILLACISLSRAQCPEGWTSAGFHCYKAFDQPQTWKDAESHCQSLSVGKNTAHVTSVLGIPENVLLKNWLELTKTNVTESWLGLHPVDNEEEVLDDEWSDGGHADLTVWIEEGILDDEFMFMTKMCLVLNTAEGIWLPTDCNKPRPYVCKLSTCPPGWVAHGVDVTTRSTPGSHGSTQRSIVIVLPKNRRRILQVLRTQWKTGF
ncbi:snaclec alboaggregin-A subunit beta'-like [Amphiura filiformis]|uniref:snaclec alboaggregin-A subunit beta'-like n=1 Tax=Amphiura filiformis TaxID=82378 RepID=UPI003B210FD9